MILWTTIEGSILGISSYVHEKTSQNSLKRVVYVWISSGEEFCPMEMFSKMPGFMDMSIGIVLVMLHKFPSESTLRVRIGGLYQMKPWRQSGFLPYGKGEGKKICDDNLPKASRLMT